MVMYFHSLLRAGPRGNLCYYAFLNVRISRYLSCYLHCGAAYRHPSARCCMHTGSRGDTVIEKSKEIMQKSFLTTSILHLESYFVILSCFDKWILTRISLR